MAKDLIDANGGEAGKQRGMSDAAGGSPPGWLEEATALIRKLAVRHPYIVVDDLWAAGLEMIREPRALGPAMKRAQTLGFIEPTGMFIMTHQRKSHMAPMRVWRSLLCRGATDFDEKKLFSRAGGGRSAH